MHDSDNFEPAALLPLLFVLVLFYGAAAAIVVPFGLPLLRDGQLPAVLGAVAAIGCCAAVLHYLRRPAAASFSPPVVKAAAFSTAVISVAFAFHLASIAYFAVKPAIPLINGHSYDQALAALQQRLFDGFSPSRWLIHQISRREVHLLDISYNMFMPFLAVSLMIAVYVKGLKGAVRFSVAQFIGLFICLIIACAFPTHGPIFQHPADFFPKLADTMSAQLAHYLVTSDRIYQTDPTQAPLIAGIAAMPSYHVFSWACGLIYWRYLSRWALAFAILACAINWLSTVALGWHYALDGAAALLLIVPVWKMADGFIHVVAAATRRRPVRAPAGARPQLMAPR